MAIGEGIAFIGGGVAWSGAKVELEAGRKALCRSSEGVSHSKAKRRMYGREGA